MSQNTSSIANSSVASSVSCPLGGRDEYTPPLVSTQLLVALLSLLGNGFVLRLVRVTPSLHTPNNLFVCALAAADVLVAVNIPFYVSFYFDTPYVCDKTFCTIRLGFVYTT